MTDELTRAFYQLVLKKLAEEAANRVIYCPKAALIPEVTSPLLLFADTNKLNVDSDISSPVDILGKLIEPEGLTLLFQLHSMYWFWSVIENAVLRRGGLTFQALRSSIVVKRRELLGSWFCNGKTLDEMSLDETAMMIVNGNILVDPRIVAPARRVPNPILTIDLEQRFEAWNDRMDIEARTAGI